MAKLTKYILFGLTFFLCHYISHGQHSKIDSLVSVLKTGRVDSSYIKTSLELAKAYKDINIDSAFHYVTLAELKSQKASPKLKYQTLSLIAHLNDQKGRKDIALDYLLKKLQVAEINSLTKEKITSYLDLAVLFEGLGKKEKEFEYYELAINEAKNSRIKELIATVLASGSGFYFNIRNFDKALQLMNEVAKVDPSLKNNAEYIAGLGDIYWSIKDYTNADRSYLAAISLAERNQDSSTLMSLYNNYVMIISHQNNIKLNIEYRLKAKRIAKLKKAYEFVNYENEELAREFLGINDFDNSLLCLNEAVAFYSANKSFKKLNSLCNLKASILFKIERYKEAYEFLEKANESRDLISNTETQNKLSELESSLLGEKKDKEIFKKDAEAKQKATERNAFIVGFSLMIVLAFFIYRSYRLKRQANEVMAAQKHLIEEKQKDILDSIRYAKRIQQSLLPTEKYIDKVLNVKDKKN